MADEICSVAEGRDAGAYCEKEGVCTRRWSLNVLLYYYCYTERLS
jgi:hypothetical protein